MQINLKLVLKISNVSNIHIYNIDRYFLIYLAFILDIWHFNRKFMEENQRQTER